ncbi:amidase [Phytohalomonas tamaricis]|uniref:amidase n=1 Tax=Phytohalomonas tamaricis TaxID=2081032 RepID=UPI000D0B9321|nr:amidase family protein [Phytohalomonas tamaricis]
MHRDNIPARLVQWIASLALIFIMVPSAAASNATFDPFDKTLGKLEKALNNGDVSSEQLVDYYLERIEALDNQGPDLNAFVALNPDARRQAQALDEERRTKGPRGPLHGIPFVVKDNMDVVGFATTAGSVALKQVYPQRNAFVVQRLLDAGAILLGKANMTEFATSFGRPGYGSLDGAARNPYDLRYTASGSSSGPAVAVAANMAAFSLGTDTEGSIRGPANVNGLVGLRPTLGLLSRSGIFPLATSFDTPGPLAKTVEDIARVLDALQAVDKQDDATLLSASKPIGHYADALDAHALDKARIGVVTNFSAANADVKRVMRQAVKRLRDQGADVERVTLPQYCGTLWDSIIAPVQNAEFKPGIERYLAKLKNDDAPRTLEALIARCEANNRTGGKHPVNPSRIRGMKSALADHSIASPAYLDAVTYKMPAMRAKIANVMDTGHFDALFFPSSKCPPPPLERDNAPNYRCTTENPNASANLASVTGFPELTLPAGYTVNGLPIGVSLLGRPFSERRLLSLAYALEQAALVRHPPREAPQQLSSSHG